MMYSSISFDGVNTSYKFPDFYLFGSYVFWKVWEIVCGFDVGCLDCYDVLFCEEKVFIEVFEVND